MSNNPEAIARRIRDKVLDLNDELILAALAEMKVEFVIFNGKDYHETTELKVWCGQEV